VASNDFMKDSEFDPTRPSRIDTSRAHPARMYDCLLDGKDYYPIDRAAVEKLLKAAPHIQTAAQANRAFLGRAVDYLVRQAGITQILDIGTGLPGPGNTHEVAQRANKRARVVYVDNDPLVLAHARALMASAPEGRTAFVDADLRYPTAILAAPELREALDLSQPVAVLLIAVMHFVEDRNDPYEIVRTLMDALPSGSYLALTHATGDFGPEAWEQVVKIYHDEGNEAQVRSLDEVDGFFAGLQRVEPGTRLVTQWRPPDEFTAGIPAAHAAVYGGIGLKT
jgi:SpoU rRNA methylase family enzyme